MPDGVLALAPNGVDLGSPEGRALLAARERGTDLLGAVRERWSSAAPATDGTVRHSMRPMLVAAVAVLAIGGAAILATAKGAFRSGRPPTSRQTSPQRAPSAAAPVVTLPILTPLDSGAWTLQLAAYGAPERALAHADRLVAESVPAMVSPMAPDASGSVWYRVQTGVYADRAAAMAARLA